MKAELKRQNGKFVVEVDGEVVISVSHRTNLIKNFRNNKKVISAGVTDLVEGDTLIYSLDKKVRVRKVGKIKKSLQFSGKYANILNQLVQEKEFKHSELLKRVGLTRPNTELQRELNKFNGAIEKINLGVGKGVLYRVI